MCFGGSSENTTITTAQLDPLTEQIKKTALDRAMGILNQSYPGYDWKLRTAPLNTDHNAGFSAIRKLAQPGSQRIVDEGGPLGKISDYINPNLDSVLAPALRDVARSGAQQRNEIGAGATMANAFGDARHGVVEGEQMRGENEVVGDLSAEARNAAWNNAMALRTGDRQNMMDTAGALIGIGDKRQQLEQTGLDRRYEEFLRGSEWPFRQLDAILSILSGSPTARTETSSTSQPNNWLMQLLGSLGGAFL